ncbi:LGFP repeat-containing protein [Phytohabitans houttuyneae]|uniref:Uncharacterized protein n=1 Tax=Phytohabitans houttuyneae TaxID=1076126 RepID=A0A6V8KG51_9ACTN|nr:hypothetical protein [Phytohabitans houttuyneae]GFJ81016.1 hypothetical protein Phou_051960 [Phytohabitans houttuyneae]
MTTCVHDAVGLIGDRWRETGAELGPLGCPLGPEADDGAGNRVQVFERGEIAWCPRQDMVVTCYRLRDYACFEWQLASEHYHYEWWQFEAFIDGRRLGRSASLFTYDGDVPHRQRRGRMPMRIQSAGRYEFEIRGCDDPDGDRCEQGWTKRIGFTVGHRDGNPFPDDAPVDGLIADRWHLYDAWDGPLGRPTGPAVTTAEGARQQTFTNGQISVDPRFGDLATVLYTDREAVFFTWGPASYPEAGGMRPTHYRVDWHREQGEPVVAYLEPDDAWVEFSCGGYQLRDGLPAGRQELRLFPGLPDSPYGEVGPAQPVPSVLFQPRPGGVDLGPAALGGTPAAAVATDAARIRAVVDAFAASGTVLPSKQLYHNEDLGALLVAHLQAVRDHGDGRYTVPGGWLPTATMVNEALLNLRPTSVGTDSDKDLSDLQWVYCRKINGEYDTLLKHLVAIAYRYDDLLQPRVRAHLLDWLLSVRGRHDEAVMTKQLCCNWSELGAAAVAAAGIFLGPIVLPGLGGPPCIPIPESENHVLLIESSRYLTNQLLHRRDPAVDFDNGANGFRQWMLNYLQVAARHDFLEFNARPYLRYTFNALLNLAEFADDEVSTAAQLLLDYLTVKFAVSSSRLRRLGPFRRLRDQSYAEDPVGLNDLYGRDADEMTAFFHHYTGPPPLADGSPGKHIPHWWFIECLLAGLAPYRPPVAAYVLALDETWTGTHSFHLGLRPPIPAGEQADAGVESYYRSPSFLLTSGGIFLNSGYANDGIAKYKNAAMPQPITLLPTGGALTFDQLIRLDVWPDVRSGVNTAAFHGFACGANLHIPAWLKDPATPLQGWYTFNLDADRPEHGNLGLYVAALVTAPAEIYDEGQPSSAWPTNWAFFYAVEATSMPSFEEFERRTIEDNRDLIPGDSSSLRAGVDYVFNAPDGKRIEFVIAPSSDRQFGERFAKGDRYSMRIRRVGNATAPADLQQLPLAAGSSCGPSGTPAASSSSTRAAWTLHGSWTSPMSSTRRAPARSRAPPGTTSCGRPTSPARWTASATATPRPRWSSPPGPWRSSAGSGPSHPTSATPSCTRSPASGTRPRRRPTRTTCPCNSARPRTRGCCTGF